VTREEAQPVDRPVAAAVPSCADDALPWLSVDQMREVDRLMVQEMHISLLQMMENAGRNLAVLARALVDGDVFGRRVHVIAGSGGNGGGGLVAARHLHNAGADVVVSMTSQPEDLSPATRQQLKILRSAGVPVGVGVPQTPTPELVVDALLGYNQRGNPRGDHANLINWSKGRRVLALDVPSGLELESGTIRTPYVQAVATLTLALPKHGLRSPGAAGLVGKLFVADISVPATVYQRVGAPHRPQFGRGPIVHVAAGRAPAQGACGPDSSARLIRRPGHGGHTQPRP
jgi:NAD(P)H-hydrate epimerase